MTESLYAWRANATLFSVEVSSSDSCIMFWLALRSGYASASANMRPRVRAQRAFGAGQRGHGGGIARIGGRCLHGRHRLVARGDHGFERFTLVLHVALGGLHQVGDEVVAARELHVDLRERVLVAVARADQAVVQRDDEPDGDDNYAKKNPTHDGPPRSALRRAQDYAREIWVRSARNARS